MQYLELICCVIIVPYQKELLFILSCQKHLVGGRGIIPLLINFMNLLPHMGIWSMKAKDRAGSGQSPTRKLASGSWVLSGTTRPGPDFGWPDPARTKKIALLDEKLVKNWPK